MNSNEILPRTNRAKYLIALLFVTLAAIPQPTRSDTFVVQPDGVDTNAGTAAAPWKTLQRAANVVNAGDTVVVSDGDYAGFVCRRSGTAAQRIVFQSKTKHGAKVTKVSPSGAVDWITLLSASYVTIDGFEVSGAKRAGICVRSLGDDTGADTRDDIVQNCHSHHNGLPSGGAHDGVFTGFALNFIVQDCEVDNNGEHGIYISNSADNPIARRNHSHHNKNCGIQLNADMNTGGGHQDGLISNWLVEDNRIHDNGAGGGAGINLDGDQAGICRNNLIYNNLATGIALYGIDGAKASSNNQIVNNTIYNPNSRRAALLIAKGASGNIVFNNILYSGTGAGIEAEAPFQHDYNLVSRIEGGTLAAHESSPAVSTIFVDIAAEDFHPKAVSPALRAGTASFGGVAAANKSKCAGVLVDAVAPPQ